MPDSSPFLKALNKKKQPLPSASIGQYEPSAPAAFSPQSAAASNPMLAPQFDTSYAPSSGGPGFQKNPYDSSSAFNTGDTSFNSFGSDQPSYTNPFGQKEYADPISYSGRSGGLQSSSASLSDSQPQALSYQDPFQATKAPFQFRSETSSSAVRPTDATEISTAAPSRDAYTGKAVGIPSAVDEGGSQSIFNPSSTGSASDAAALDPLLESLGSNESVQAPLTADSFGSVSFPGLQQQGMDQRLQTAGEEQERMRELSRARTDAMVANARGGTGSAILGLADQQRFGVEKPLQEGTLPSQLLKGAGIAADTVSALGETAVDYSKDAIGAVQNAGEYLTGIDFNKNGGVVPTPAAPVTPAAAPVAAASPEAVQAGAAVVQNPDSLFNAEPSSLFSAETEAPAGVAPTTLAGVTPTAPAGGQPIKQLATPEDPIIDGLTGIINVRGKDYGYTRDSPNTPVEVTPERKAAFEKRAAEFRALNEIGSDVQPIDAQGNKMKFTDRSDPVNWTPKEKKNFAETGDINMSGAGKRAYDADAPARERKEAARVQKKRVADRKKENKSEMDARIRENNRSPQSMAERKAFKKGLEAEYRQKEQFARAEDVERSKIESDARNAQARLGLGEKELAANVDYRNKSLAQGDRQIDATLAEGQRELAAEQTQKLDTIVREGQRMDSQLSFLTDSAMKMSGMQDWSTEGFAGWAAEKLPFQTKAAQVNRLATSFQGNAFLRSIIDSKSLGATFGALSDTEGTKITAADAILMDTKMGNVERMDAAKQIIDTITSARANAMGRLERAGGGGNSGQAAPRQSGNVPQVEGVTITSIG